MTKLGALRDLESRLRQIKMDYDAATTDNKADWQDRLAGAVSLMAVIDFMERMPGWQGLDFGLTKLVEALSDIEDGRTPKWLTNASVGRPPVSIRTTLLRARCASVMEFLMSNGRQREEAARFVLRHLPQPVAETLAGPTRSRTWRSIAGWRDQVIGSTGIEQAQERDGYQRTLKFLAGMKGPIDQRAKDILKAVAKQATKVD